VDGCAEASGLDTESIDFITAGQAFHWFDRVATKHEFKRILRPGGHVALIWNERHHHGTAFQAGYEDLLQKYCNDYSQVNYKGSTGFLVGTCRVYHNERV
jgi:ubiquinone/menaquinone biosynthesis C-methylase UbiE